MSAVPAKAQVEFGFHIHEVGHYKARTVVVSHHIPVSVVAGSVDCRLVGMVAAVHKLAPHVPHNLAC